MRILVTGGAGFIGSHIVDSLVAQGHEVVVYDNFSTGLIDNLQDSKSNIEIVRGDILDYELLEKTMKGCDTVSHHAAQLEIFLSIFSPAEDLKQNTIGTLNVLRAAKTNNVKKVINASSACVYGQTESASQENDDVTPNWAYGVSKLAAEKYARIYNDYEGLPVVSLRYAIVYGEREWYRRVLPIFLKRIINGEAPVVFGAGKQVRDFIYVRDVVDLHNRCLENDVVNGEVLNVGTGVPTTIEELAWKVCELAASPLRPVYEQTAEGEFSKMVAGKKRNAAELQTMLLDITKARRLLGWRPNWSLLEGLKREHRWASDNLWRWDKIKYTVA